VTVRGLRFAMREVLSQSDITSQSVEELSHSLVSGSAQEREEALRRLEDAESHADLQVRLAAYQALGEVDREAADRKISDLISSVRRRTGNLHAWSFGWAVASVIAVAVGLAISDAFSEPGRLLAFGVLALAFKMIKVILDQWRRNRAVHREMLKLLDTLGRQDPVGLIPLLPELRRVAAFRNGQELPLRREATALVKRLESAAREQGALPVPAASPETPIEALPRPASAQEPK
jgi:hypothetical protein